VWGAVDLQAGLGDTCALFKDGTAKCWGSNDRGQLGDGTTVARSVPTRVKVTGKIESLVSGDLHTCARFDDGSVRCWGDNRSGQLGDGTTEQRALPVTMTW
jgi:alpha-tubulin suppressor-like RCC1 family protein